MNDNFALNLPFNPLSFGNIGFSIAKECFKRGLQPSIFPIGNVDASAQTNLSQDFINWLNSCIGKALKTHKRSNPCFKLWHLANSLESLSDKQVLLSFVEVDQLTAEEINTIKNNYKVLFTTKYNLQICQDYGLENNVGYCPLGFDSDNFHVINKQFFTDDRISFSLCGKFESRKGTEQVVKAWIRKFGNQSKYYLNAAIFNPFLKPEDNQNIVNKIMSEASNGQRIWNVQFLGFMPQNASYNQFLNANEINIAAGTESWNLPSFTSCALGKTPVVLNVAGHKEWSTELNSAQFSPNGKRNCVDNMFFHPNQPFNQGNFYTFSDEDFIQGCEQAIKRVEKNRINTEGLKLQQDFTWSKTVDIILKELENV